jgi:DNA-binding response OmpR family regulator
MTERPGACIWWLEDDRQLCRLVADRLRACGWRLSLFHSVSALLAALQHHEPDVLLLDRLLPGADALDLLERLRRESRTFPVLILSGLGSPDQRIEGLAQGASDYLPKPFRFKELVLRLERLLLAAPPRLRTHCLLDGDVPVGPLVLDRNQGYLRAADGSERRLARGDAALLLTLLQAPPGAVLSREQLARASGSLVDVTSSRSLDVRLSRLRRQLRQLSGDAVSIAAVRGQGYRLELPSELPAELPAEALPPAAGLALVLPAQLLLPTWMVMVLLLVCVGVGGWLLWRQVLWPLARLRAALTPREPDLSIAPLPVAGIRPLRQLVARLNVLHAGQMLQTAEQHVRLQTLVHDQRAPMTRLMLRLETLQPDQPPGQDLLDALTTDLDLICELQQQVARLFEGPLLPLVPELVALDELCLRIAGHYPRDSVKVAVPRLIVRVEAELLRRVLHNLIDNAHDHGSTPVLIRAQALSDGVVMEVMDQGRLRSERPPLVHSGWPHQGLGFVTALDFCRRHGGRLELEPQPGGGLLVRLRIAQRFVETGGAALLTAAKPVAP